MLRRFTVVSGLLALCAGLVFALVTWSGGANRVSAAAAQIAYVPIDPSVFVRKKTVAGWVAVHNEPAVRAHAAALWAGLTALTSQKLRGTRLAVYDTWYTPCQVYPDDPSCGTTIIHSPLEPEIPEQALRTPRLTATNVFSSVRYNLQMKQFVDRGYAGATYVTGAGLVSAIAAQQTDLVDTAAASSMSVKPTYQLLSATQPTVITYWGGPGLNVRLGSTTSPLTPGSDTWLKVAVVDPTGKVTNTKPVTFCANTYDTKGDIVSSGNYTAPPRSYDVIPLSQFYSIPLGATDQMRIAQLRAQFSARQYARLRGLYGARAVAHAPIGCPYLTPVNPTLALVGMHVITAEFQDTWTWQTFWWQPDVKPLPGSRGPFAHFDVAEAYWTVDSPPYNFHYAFNPYLEAPFGTSVFLTPAWPNQAKPGSVINLGRTTNCISCHSQATYTIPATPTPSPGYVAHGDQPQAIFANSIKTRNLWSLAGRAGHPAAVASPASRH
jgi:hypothetical protein